MTTGNALEPIRISLAPRRSWFLLQCGVLLVSLAAFYVTRLPFFSELFYIAAPVWVILLALSLLSSFSVSALEIGGPTAARICLRQRWLDASVAGDSYIAPWLLVLRLDLIDGRRLAVTILPWAASQQVLRRLRVRLLWQGR